MRRRRSSALYGGVALSLLWAAAAAADFREIYREGRKAIDEKRWEDAARFFRHAIDERGEERVAAFGKDYLPHFYLGVALAESGDCRGALESWAESERQGKVFKAKEEASLQDRKSACEERLRRVDAARSAVEDLLRQAPAVSATLDGLARNPALVNRWSRGEPSYGTRRRAAEDRLEQARRQMEEGAAHTDLELLAGAEELAAQGLQGLRRIVSEARQELGELEGATAGALAELEAGETEAREALRAVADLAPYPRGLARRYADVERILATIADRRDAAQARELTELKAELAEVVRQLEVAAERPPRRLSDAVEAFLAGRYQETLDTLAGAAYGERRAATHLHVLRAASRHALFVLGGESDPALRDRAIADALACHERNPGFEPSRKFFSPRFITFYDEAVHPPEPGGGHDGAEPAAAGSHGAESPPPEARTP